MPVVRRVERSIGSTGLPNARKSAAATPASEGALTEQARQEKEQHVAAVGEQVERIGLTMYQTMQEEERKKSHETALLKASNGLSEAETALMYDTKTGALLLKGEAALGAPEQVLTALDRRAKEIEAGLTTEAQRADFAKMYGQTRTRIDRDVRRHAFEQIEEFRAKTIAAKIDHGHEEAVRAASDPPTVIRKLNETEEAMRTGLKSLGKPPEEIDNAVRALRSKVHVDIISTLVAQDKTQEAQDYFELTEAKGGPGQIDASVKDSVITQIKGGTAKVEGFKAADKILAAGGTLEQQMEKARALPASVREVVEQRLQVADARADELRREGEIESLREAFAIVEETGDIYQIPQAQRDALAPHMGALRAAAIQKATGMPRITDTATRYTLMELARTNPKKFLEQNLLTYKMRLSEGDLQELTGLRMSITNGDRAAANKVLQPFTIQKDVLDSALTLYGYDPNAKPDSTQGKQIAQLRDLLRAEGDRIEQANGGKPATNEEIQKAADTILSASVTKPNFWTSGSTASPLIKATIKDVPASFRNRYPGVSDKVLLANWIAARLALQSGRGPVEKKDPLQVPK